MANIVYLWDFEDGTTQGWELGPYSTLDSNSKVEGRYSIKYSYETGPASRYPNDLVAKVANVDLTGVAKPLLLLVVKDESSGGLANNPGDLVVVVRDGDGNVVINYTVRLSKSESGWVRVVAVDLSPASGMSNVTIEFYERGEIYYYHRRVHYFDVIAVVDGADYEYDVGILAFKGEERTVDVEVPDSDVSTLNANRVGVSLATPPWRGNARFVVTVSCDLGNISLDNTKAKILHTNYADFGNTTVLYFNKLTVHARPGMSDWVGCTEKIAVVFMDALWRYKAVYMFDIAFTFNPYSPKFATAIYTTTYDTSVSGKKDYTLKVYGRSLDVAVKAVYVVGDNTVVSSGSITLEVWDSGLSTKYGEVSIDLTAGTEVTSNYITELPTNTELVLRVKWGLAAKSRVIVLVYLLLRVS